MTYILTDVPTGARQKHQFLYSEISALEAMPKRDSYFEVDVTNSN